MDDIGHGDVKRDIGRPEAQPNFRGSDVNVDGPRGQYVPPRSGS